MGIRSISLALVAAVMATLVAAQSLDERSRAALRARRIEDRLRALQEEADGLARQQQSLLTEIRRLQVARDLRAQELQLLQVRADAARQNLADTNARIAALDRVVHERRPAIAAQLVQLYKLGPPGYARLLLSVEDVRGLGRGYREVTALALNDRYRVGAQLRDLAGLTTARAGLEQTVRELESVARASVEARRSLDRATADKQRLIAAIGARRDLAVQLTTELMDAQRQVQVMMAELAAGRSPPRLQVPVTAFEGDLDWPVIGRLAAPFGRQRHPRFGTIVLRNGIDIGAPAGTVVRAVHDGTVVYAEPFRGFANLVIIDHGRQCYSLYGYLDGMTVTKGQAVDRGEALGTSGLAPAGDPAVYFELRIDGRPVDPVEWLRKRSP